MTAAFLLLLTVIEFRHQIIERKALYWGDIGLYFTPMQLFLKQNFQAGHLPLWNPLILCGTPYVGNPQVWPLYPATALLPFVSVTQFFNLTIGLHVWLAGMGMYAFARRGLGVGTGPALLAAITFMFGGQLVSKEQFPNMVQAAAWLPWVLFFFDRLLRRRHIQDSLLLGLSLGLQLLAAHVQMTLLTLYLAAAYGVFIRFSVSSLEKPPRPNSGEQHRGRNDQRHLFLSLVIASGLAMGQILPTLALFRDAARQKLSFAVVDRFYLPFNETGNFVLPYLHGSPYFGNWTARGNFWETCCYVGVLPFALTLWGVVAACRRNGSSEGRFWTGVFVFGLGMAFGGPGGLYYLAYWALPGFRSFHDPARCLLWTCFALSVLAALGLEQMSWVKRTPMLSAIILLAAFADLAHFERTLYPLADPAALLTGAPNVTLMQNDPDVQAHQARILAPTGGVWLRFTRYKDYRQSVPSYQTLWSDTLTPNLMMPYGLRDAFGYEPVSLKNMQTAAGRATRAFGLQATVKERAEAAVWSGALAVKYVSLCRVTPPQETLPGLIAVRAAPTLALLSKQHGARALIYLSRNAQWQPRAHLENSAQPVHLVDDGPDQVILSFRSQGPDRVILEDTQAAGWSATLDGQPAEIATDNGCLRAIDVPQPGLHRVVFSYAPTPFRLGFYLSLLTVAGLFGAAGYIQVRKLAGREG